MDPTVRDRIKSRADYLAAQRKPKHVPESKAVVADSQHLQQIAEIMAEHNCLLYLNKPAADFLIPHLPQAADAVERELALRIEEPFEYYIDEDGCFFVGIVLKDLNVLRSLPGGAIKALNFLVLISSAQLAVRTQIFCSDDDGFLEYAEIFDDQGVTTIRQILQRLKKEGEASDVCAAAESMRSLRKEHLPFFQTIGERYKESNRNPGSALLEKLEQPSPVFKKSLYLLRKWHSRDAGAMLAMKVAGHLLPPELVEHITEHYNEGKELGDFDDDELDDEEDLVDSDEEDLEDSDGDEDLEDADEDDEGGLKGSEGEKGDEEKA